MDDFTKRVTTAPKLSFLRLIKGMWGQAGKTPVCPDLPRLDGRLALVTGGNSGIGLETSMGLARRGADVVIAARDIVKGENAVQRIGAKTDSGVHFLNLDLADLESVAKAADEIPGRWSGRKLDLLVANAGIWPTSYAVSAQGYEIAFATNVLGHYALIRRLLERSILTPTSRVVVLTGDIYIFEKECTPDYQYKNSRGCQRAYCRSKLGDLWMAAELARRYPDMDVYSVHPGVVASGLGGQDGNSGGGPAIPTESGAQTSLICATQPGLIPGAYYHNTMGRVILRDNDPAVDSQRAAAFWELLEGLAAGFLG